MTPENTALRARAEALWQRAVTLGPAPGETPPDPATLPPLRLIRNLPRVGGTLLARCLASMEGVCLLSEINLRGPSFNPLLQLQDWYEPLPPATLAALERDDPPAAAVLARVAGAIGERGLIPVVRDWCLVEFILPHLSDTPLADNLVPELAFYVQPRQLVLVRHPVDTLASLSRLSMAMLVTAKQARRLTLETFLQGYEAFLNVHAGQPLIRFEDLVQAPDATLQAACAHLDLPFDPGYRQRFGACEKVTGSRPDGARHGSTFVLPPRNDEARNYQEVLRRFPLYHDLVARLGYEA